MTDKNELTGSEAPNGISRRTVTKAMAWAVPVIAISTAVPAYAASRVNITFLGAGCKLPGNSNPTYKGYAFLISIENLSSVDVVIDIISIKLGGNLLGGTAIVDLPPSGSAGASRTNPFTLTPGTNVPAAALVTADAPNSENNEIVVEFTVNGGTTQTRTASVPDVPPIQGESCDGFTLGQKAVLIAALGGIPAWKANTKYSVGDIVQVPGGILSATKAGTSSSINVPPTPPAAGGTVNDGTVIWERASDA